MAEWQTRRSQKPLGRKAHVGSTPTFGTINESKRGVLDEIFGSSARALLTFCSPIAYKHGDFGAHGAELPSTPCVQTAPNETERSQRDETQRSQKPAVHIVLGMSDLACVDPPPGVFLARGSTMLACARRMALNLVGQEIDRSRPQRA